MKLFDDDVLLMGIYMFAQTKFCLENRDLSTDASKVNSGTWKLVAAYLENPAHNVKLTKKLNKLIDANKKGELEAFLAK